MFIYLLCLFIYLCCGGGVVLQARTMAARGSST
jgi:hypothetical protein